MPSRRRSNSHAVAYTIKGLGNSVTVSNQFVAKIIYKQWVMLAQQKEITGTVAVYALMSPNGWSTWSRKHIIALMNNAWKWRLMCKTIITKQETKETLTNNQFTVTGDEYERFAEYEYSTMHHNVLHALHNATMYPNVLRLLLRAPTALSARVAMKIEGYLFWPDGTKIDHIDKVWEYLNFENKRT
jgi:hypothetical protein